MKKLLFLTTVALVSTIYAAQTGDIIFTETNSSEDEELFPSKTDLFTIVDFGDTDLFTRGPENNTDTIDEKQLEEHARAFLKKHLIMQQLSLEELSQEKQKLLTVLIKNLCAQCRQQCVKSNVSIVKKSQFNTLLKTSFERIYGRTTETFIVEKSLATTVDGIVKNLFKSAGIALINLPTNMKLEFTQRRNEIIAKIKRLMHSRKTEHVSIDEIEDTVNKAFEAFIERVNHVFAWTWVCAELENLNTEDKIQAKTSSIQPNPKSKALHTLVKSLRKINN